MLAALLLAFPALFSIVNPIAGAFIFREATADRTHAERVKLARRVGLYSLLVMLVALWAGSYVLALFGITIAALRIAGGIWHRAGGGGDGRGDLADLHLCGPLVRPAGPHRQQDRDPACGLAHDLSQRRAGRGAGESSGQRPAVRRSRVVRPDRFKPSFSSIPTHGPIGMAEGRSAPGCRWRSWTRHWGGWRRAARCCSTPVLPS